jgi:hypothetical protein
MAEKDELERKENILIKMNEWQYHCCKSRSAGSKISYSLRPTKDVSTSSKFESTSDQIVHLSCRTMEEILSYGRLKLKT